MLSKYNTTLQKVVPLTSDVRLFRFTLNNSQKLTFLAGQYMILTVPDKNGQSVKRLYSIASADNIKDEFELIVKIVPNGLASTYLSNLHQGDTVDFEGPAGLFTMRETSRDKIFMVTGCGLTPALSMIKSYAAKLNALNIKIILFWGLSYITDAYLVEDLKKLADIYSNFSFHICLSREKDFTPIKSAKCFHQARVTDGWREFIKAQDVNQYDYYLCSGRDILDSLKQYLYDNGANRENVFFEKF